MGTPSFFYSIISRVAAIVLLIAGGLKAKDFLTPPALDPQWTVLVQTALELFLGAWLLVGLYPRWSRIIALVCFLTFLNVAVWGALQGKASCGCFGKAVSIRPWSAAGLDALLVVGLLFSPAAQLRESILRTTRMRWFAFAVSAFLVLLVLGWPLVRNVGAGEKHIPTQVSDDMPSGIDASALERVIQDVERNHAALHTLVYTTEKSVTQYPMKRTGTRVMLKGNERVKVTGTWVEPETEKRSRHAWKTWIRGDEVRRDGISHGGGATGGDILLSSKGNRIQYEPKIRQAWIATGEFVDADYSESIDLRCAGFQPPMRSIADWLGNRCEVVNAGLAKDRAGREVIRIRARVKKNSKNECEVIADFVQAMNCLPSRIVYNFLPDGGVFTVTDIEYHQVGSKGAWFPLKIRQRSFPRNTTSDSDSPTGQNLSMEMAVNVLAVGQGVQDEDFDPILPAKTLLRGDLAAQNDTGNAPIRASNVTRTEPLKIMDAAPLRQGSAAHTSSWSFVAGMDVLLLGFCLMFRKRLAF